jgi:hypothetical protein
MIKAGWLQRREWHFNWLSGVFIIKRKKAIPHLKGTAVFPGESKRFYSRPAKHLELLKRSC